MSKRLEKLQQNFANLSAQAKIAEQQIAIEKENEAKKIAEKKATRAAMCFALIDGAWHWVHSKLVQKGTPTLRIETMEKDGFFGHKVVSENLPKIVPVFPQYVPSHKTYNGFLLRSGYKFHDGTYVKE